MKEPALVVMAAGMGSRFGGLKQISPVDSRGHAMIDYSLYDAYRAGFRRVVFIIKHAIEADFRAAIGERAEKFFNVSYVFQELGALPKGYVPPEGREKPWGTGHAVACCRGTVEGPFAVINADDFYGAEAYSAIFDFLSSAGKPGVYAMVGYRLRNTLTENGYVSRGICEVEGGLLRGVTERTHIEKRGSAAAYTEDGKSYVPLTGDETVSMNLWGFTPDFLDALNDGMGAFLDRGLAENPLKCEYFLPSVVSSELDSGRCSVRVLTTDASWHGVTYREDLGAVRTALDAAVEKNIYPGKILGK